MSTQFDESTSIKAEKHANEVASSRSHTDQIRRCTSFIAGRNSAKESLVHMAEALEGIAGSVIVNELNRGTARFAMSVIMAVKKNGDWPLEEKNVSSNL